MNTGSPKKLKLYRVVFETGVHNGKNGFCVVFPYNRKHTTQLKIRKKPIEAGPTTKMEEIIAKLFTLPNVRQLCVRTENRSTKAQFSTTAE